MFGIGKYNFKELTADTIVFTTGFTGRKLRISSKFIDVIYICRLQGILHEYRIVSKLKDFTVPKINFDIDEIKGFCRIN